MLLDHRITIQRATRSANAYNEQIETWSDYITVSAQRRDVSGREAYKAQEVNAEITARFTVRYSPEVATVTPKDRLILEDGLTYQITVVREIQRNKWVEIDTVVRVDK